MKTEFIALVAFLIGFITGGLMVVRGVTVKARSGILTVGGKNYIVKEYVQPKTEKLQFPENAMKCGPEDIKKSHLRLQQEGEGI